MVIKLIGGICSNCAKPLSNYRNFKDRCIDCHVKFNGLNFVNYYNFDKYSNNVL